MGIFSGSYLVDPCRVESSQVQLTMLDEQALQYLVSSSSHYQLSRYYSQGSFSDYLQLLLRYST